MINQQLQDYIVKARQHGMSDDDIRKSLLDVGWQEPDVNECFNFSPSPNRATFFTKKKILIITLGLSLILIIVTGTIIYLYLYRSVIQKQAQSNLLPTYLPQMGVLPNQDQNNSLSADLPEDVIQESPSELNKNRIIPSTEQLFIAMVGESKAQSITPSDSLQAVLRTIQPVIYAYPGYEYKGLVFYSHPGLDPASREYDDFRISIYASLTEAAPDWMQCQTCDSYNFTMRRKSANDPFGIEFLELHMNAIPADILEKARRIVPYVPTPGDITTSSDRVDWEKDVEFITYNSPSAEAKVKEGSPGVPEGSIIWTNRTYGDCGELCITDMETTIIDVENGKQIHK